MEKNKLHIFLLIILIISLGMIGYFGYHNYLLKKNKLVLEDELLKTRTDFASTTKNLQAVIGELMKTKTERDDFEQKYNEEKNRMDFLASQIEGIQGTVGILEKLSRTDPELLKKYSKVYFLNDNSVPETFIKIEPKYTYDPQNDYLIYEKISPFL